MNWEAIGATGEIIGALVVFLTFVYLALQIRQNTHATRAASHHAVTDALNQLNLALATDEVVASIWVNGMNDRSSLTDIQRERMAPRGAVRDTASVASTQAVSVRTRRHERMGKSARIQRGSRHLGRDQGTKKTAQRLQQNRNRTTVSEGENQVSRAAVVQRFPLHLMEDYCATSNGKHCQSSGVTTSAAALNGVQSGL
jgi:hypothetical protein